MRPEPYRQRHHPLLDTRFPSYPLSSRQSRGHKKNVCCEERHFLQYRKRTSCCPQCRQRTASFHQEMPQYHWAGRNCYPLVAVSPADTYIKLRAARQKSSTNRNVDRSEERRVGKERSMGGGT